MRRNKLFSLITIISIMTLISACGGQQDNTTVEPSQQVESETTYEKETETETESETETEPVLEFFESNENVNNFFVKYNEIAENKVDASIIEKGNIDTKALAYSDTFSMEVIDARGFLSLSISSSPDSEDTVLKAVFTDSIKAMKNEYTDDEISGAWDALHETGYLVDGYEFNDLKITYVPYKELSQGHSNLRIDIEFPTE